MFDEDGQSSKQYKVKKNLQRPQLKLMIQNKTANTITTSSARQMCEYDDSLDEHMENYNVETTALHRKLQSKMEALRILRKELDKFRTERDQFKLMAETLQLRYAALRRYNISDCGNSERSTIESKSTVAKILNETREHNIKLTTEVEALKQKLSELQGDIEVLRKNKQSVKQSRGKKDDAILMDSYVPDNFDNNSISNWKDERSNFIYHLEQLKKQNAQLAFDLKTVLDEKDELINERDAYKCKTHRLNHELLAALKAKDIHPKFIDIDSVLLENKYLHERLNNVENEVEITKKSINKYKSSLESKRSKGIIKLGKMSNSEEKILSQKQVKNLLGSGIDMPAKTETIQELKSLCVTLLDNLNDKNLALNHQKKTNKVLAAKISEQERRLQLLSGINCSTESDGFSVSKYLLQGYNSSVVDACSISPEEKPHQICNENAKCTLHTMYNSPNIKVRHSLDECQDLGYSKTSSGSEDANILKNTCEIYSDDAISSFSTESGRSILSSEYDIVNAMYKNDQDNSKLNKIKTSTAFSYKTPSSASESQKSFTMPYMKNTIVKQRNDDLKDLPPELAALVQKALDELDLRDFDEVVSDGINESNINVNNDTCCKITAINETRPASADKAPSTNGKTSESTASKLIQAT